MNTENTSLLLIAYGFSNLAALLILWAAFRRPKLARLALVLLFGWAAWINYSTVRETPDLYLNYSRYAIKWYDLFIEGWFRQHITFAVTCIAVGQALISLGMLYRGVWVNIACVGVIVFLLAIAPLGFGAAFPFSLIVAFAAWKIINNGDNPLLWSTFQFKEKKRSIQQKNKSHEKHIIRY